MAYKTITIMGDPVQKEYLATAVAITPGHLLQMASATTVQKHGTAKANAQKMFALEDDKQGKEIGDAYAVSTRIFCGIFRAGDEVNAILADGTSYSVGDFLESSGLGTLQKHTAPDISDSAAQETADTLYHAGLVAIVLEALDLSSSSGGDTVDSQRARVEIL